MKSTPCKNCCFATYEGKTQIGCQLNKIETYLINNVSVVDAYDDDKEFYVVEGRCNSYRNDKWLNQYKNLQEAKEELIKQTNVSIEYIIYADSLTKWEELRDTIRHTEKFTKQPKRLTILLNHSLEFENLHDELVLTSIPWRIKRIYETTEEGEHSPLDRCIYITSRDTSKCTFICYHKAEQTIPIDLFQKIEIAINDKAMQFIMVTDETFACIYFPLFSKTSNFGFTNIKQDIIDYAEHTNEQFMIKSYTDL